MSNTEYISKEIAKMQTEAEIAALGILLSDALKKKIKEDYEIIPAADVLPIRYIFKAGYEGRVAKFEIGGRLFEIRELPQ